MEEEVAGIAHELQLLERHATDGLSIHVRRRLSRRATFACKTPHGGAAHGAAHIAQELMGHCVGLYKANRQGVLRLEAHLQRYGQVLPRHLQQPAEPLDATALPAGARPDCRQAQAQARIATPPRAHRRAPIALLAQAQTEGAVTARAMTRTT